jgi:predicted transcriptional regulator
MFTQGELAVLRVVGDEVAQHGACGRSLAEIAARAGCCRSTAKNALRSAARAGLVVIEERRQRGRKNLPNVVRIVSTEWTTWLARGERRIAVKKIAPTNTRIKSSGIKEAGATLSSATRDGERGVMRFRQPRRE